VLYVRVMFSITTMASSTTNPVEMVSRPLSVRLLSAESSRLHLKTGGSDIRRRVPQLKAAMPR